MTGAFPICFPVSRVRGVISGSALPYVAIGAFCLHLMGLPSVCAQAPTVPFDGDVAYTGEMVAVPADGLDPGVRASTTSTSPQQCAPTPSSAGRG